MQINRDKNHRLATLLSCKSKFELCKDSIVAGEESSLSYLRSDEFASEETDGGESAVGEERDGGERVDGGVDVGKALEKLEPAGVAVPDRAVLAEENFYGPESPPENLVQTI